MTAAASPSVDTADEDMVSSLFQQHGFRGDVPNHPTDTADPPRFTPASSAEPAAPIHLTGERQTRAVDTPPPPVPEVIAPRPPDPVSFDKVKSRLRNILPAFEQRFKINPPGQKYLVESRTAFLDPQEYYGSDYFLSRLVGPGHDLEALPKRLGDAYFETTLVNEQIVSEQGKRWLKPTITSDAEQMKQLLDAGVRVAKRLNLAPGVAMSPELATALKEDIVWYETRRIAGERVSVPKVYLARSTRAKMPTHAASIEARGGIDLKTAHLTTSGGYIGSAGSMNLTVDGDLVASNSTLKSGGDMVLDVGGSMVSQTTVRHTKHAGTTEFRDMEEGHARIESGGNLNLKTGGDVTLRGTTTTAKGNVQVKAGGDLTSPPTVWNRIPKSVAKKPPAISAPCATPPVTSAPGAG